MTRRGRLVRVAVASFLGAVIFVWAVASGSFGGFVGRVTDSSDTAGGGTLAYTHTYQGTSCTSVGSTAASISCNGSLASTSATPATGAVTSSDAIAAAGTVGASKIIEQVSAPSCGPVELANLADAGNVMLPRYATTFSPAAGPMTGAGSITLDGSTAYATDVVSQAQPNPLISLGGLYGLGIWFETTSTKGGPLFEIGTSPVDASGSNDRVLYMNPNGTLSFIQNTSGATTTTTTAYNNGVWHFAYITMSAVNVVLGVESTTTIYVDGTSEARGGGLLVGYSADTGYWDLGWAPTSPLPAGVANYFAGSLSNFVVFDNSGAPSAPTAAQMASESAFSTWAAKATEHWELNDTGMTTFTGPYPVISASPCTMVNIEWGFTNPTSCAVAPESTTTGCSSSSTLAAFADDTWQTVAAPSPGGTQTAVISTSRASGYNAYVSGLRLYAPLSWRARTAPSGSWSVTFAWPSATAAFIA